MSPGSKMRSGTRSKKSRGGTTVTVPFLDNSALRPSPLLLPAFLSLAAKSDDGPELRQQLATHLPLIRVCTVPIEDFCRDIVPTGVLTGSETIEICMYQGNKDHKPVLPEICNITEPRPVPAKPFEQSALISFYISSYSNNYHGLCEELSFVIRTREHRVELYSLVLSTYFNTSLDVTVKISQVDCAEPSPPVSVSALEVDTIDFFALLDDGRGVILLPNSQYNVTISSPDGLDTYLYNSSNVSNNHLIVNHHTVNHAARGSRRVYCNEYISCIKTINYKTLTPKGTPLIG